MSDREQHSPSEQSGSQSFTALCVDDHCPWKHRGITSSLTDERARKHAREAGHDVTVYIERRYVVEGSRS